MEPIDYLGALRRSWRLLVALGLIGVIIAVLIPVHGGHGRARVRAIANPWVASALVGAPPVQAATLVGGGATGDQIDFYATSATVMRATVNSVGLRRIRTGSLPSYLQAEVVVPPGVGKREAANADTVRLTGHASTAGTAKRLTNAYAREVGIAVNGAALAREKATTHGPRVSGYQILQPALVATMIRTPRPGPGPVRSRKVRALIGLGAGVLLAAIIVLAREVMSRRLRSSARAEATFGYPVVVEIPVPLRAIGRRSLSVDVVSDPTSPASEAYRMLRMSVLFEALATKVAPTNDFSYLLTDTGTLGIPGAYDAGAQGGKQPAAGTGGAEPAALPTPESRKVVLVVSASREPTRPQVAANLAAAYAEAGERVIVIGTGDLGAGPIRGGGTNLTGEITPQDVEDRLESSWVTRVYRLDLRNFLENSGQLVNRMPAVFRAARAVSDVVIVEAPPMLAMHHVEALIHLVDVVLVVGEAGTTTFDEARRAGDFLRRMAAPVLGVVLTNVRLPYGDPRQELSRIQLELANSSDYGLPRDSDDSDLESTGAPTHSPA